MKAEVPPEQQLAYTVAVALRDVLAAQFAQDGGQVDMSGTGSSERTCIEIALNDLTYPLYSSISVVLEFEHKGNNDGKAS